MCKILRLTAAIAFALSLVANAQQTPNTPGKPALGPSAAILQQWNEIGRKLIAMAEDFPEDKYDFKPTAALRSFAERMIHFLN
jgi:hypothetical protein